ncbi:hypothetical protein [Tropheryma whipplei]|nr:hypothetical protein [Tropheryma whipplei]
MGQDGYTPRLAHLLLPSLSNRAVSNRAVSNRAVSNRAVRCKIFLITV